MRPVCVVITFYAASVIAQKNPEDEQRRQQTQFFQQQSAAEGGFIKQVTEEEYRTRAKDRQDAKILDLGDAIRDAIPDNGLSMTREECELVPP